VSEPSGRAGLDEACAALAGLDVRRDEPMARHTTFGIGGPADLWVRARDEAEVQRVLQVADQHQLALVVVGGGSNLLVGDGGVRGVTLTLGGALATLAVRDDGRVIDVGAACPFGHLTNAALDLGWPPAVGWFGTPGQVGGALVMNAGTREGQIGDVVVEVRASSAAGPLRLPRSACGFGYRASVFPAGAVLTGACLQCDSHKTDESETLKAMAQAQLTRRHATQPKLRCAGSFFKNPPGDYAGRLIEAAGLKGLAIGGARISEVHANFVVNTGGATARDVVAVAEHAQRIVKAQSGVNLEWEVRRVGEFR
jgi:UDP-N-acetylmuramate dehydrogenase